MKNFYIIWSKYNVIPTFFVNAKYEKKLKIFARIIWFFSFLLSALSFIDFLYFRNWRSLVSVVIFILSSLVTSIYIFRYQYHTQFYVVCKECGEKIPLPEKILQSFNHSPFSLRLRCKNGHFSEYKKDDVKTLEIGIAAGPEERVYKSFRIYLE